MLTCIPPQIREGFIVDEDEEEEADGVEEQRRKKKKRRRVEREEEELLDEEDLDLIGENNPEWERKSQPQVRLLAPSRPAFADLPSAIDEIQAAEARPSR